MFDSEKEVIWLLLLISLVWVKLVFWMYPRYLFALARVWLVENGVWL